MNKNDNEYIPYKTHVTIFTIETNTAGAIRKRWFEGLVTAVTSRGLIVNPLGEEEHGHGTSLDVLAGSWIPYNEFNRSIQIQISKRKHA